MAWSDEQRVNGTPQSTNGAKQMIDTIKFCTTILKDRRGVTAVEYAVIAGVMVTAVAAAFNAFGTTLKTFLTGLTL